MANQDVPQKRIRIKNRIYLQEKRFGKLLVIKEVPLDHRGHRSWLCQCDCGTEKVIPTSHLTSNGVKSCGCGQGDSGRCRNKKIIVKCFYCGKEKKLSPSIAHAYKNHFCHETNCYGKWKSKNGIVRGSNNGKWTGGPQTVKCANCGKQITKLKCHLRTYSKPFCNTRCHGEWQSKNKMLGENPNWHGGKSFEPYPIIWNEKLREMIRKRDGRKCRLCDISENGGKLTVHHVDYDKKNCDPLNLISLCHDCHVKTNFNREYWKEYFRPNIKLVVNQ